MITQKRLKELFNYDPVSGNFVRIKEVGGQLPGTIAGTLDSHGYIQIRVDRVLYLAHRLVFIYMNNSCPSTVDHINRVRTDNRWVNLRGVSRTGNVLNSKVPKNNKTGVVGVCFCNRGNKWLAYIRKNNKRRHLGYFIGFDDAVIARWEAEKEYRYEEYNKETSAFLYLKEKGLING